jgi:hypothetical protein
MNFEVTLLLLYGWRQAALSASPREAWVRHQQVMGEVTLSGHRVRLYFDTTQLQ